MIDVIFRDIIETLGICLFVETGTDMGSSVAEVAQWASEIDPDFGKITDYTTTAARGYSLNSKPFRYPVFDRVGQAKFKIYSVDIDRPSYEHGRNVFHSNPNIILHHDNSPNFLKNKMDCGDFLTLEALFFLDAHWGRYWPLRDEITQILRRDKFVIVIDDFFVPHRSQRTRPHGDFGFDFYHKRILDWGYIRDLFENVDIRVYYPTRSNRDNRGFVLLFRGYDEQELGFLRSMPLQYMDKDDPSHREPTALSPLTYLDIPYLARGIIPLSLLRRGIRMCHKLTHACGR